MPAAPRGKVTAPKLVAAAGGKPERGRSAPLDDDAFVLDMFVPYLMNRVTNRMNMKLLEALRPLRIGPPQWRVLAVLHSRGKLSLTALSVYTVVGHSTLSRTIGRMARAGLVGRSPDPQDGRYTEIALTPAGEAMFARVWPVALDQARRAVDGMETEERMAFIGSLRRMLTNLRESPLE